MTHTESPSSAISLAELRIFIDQSNILILTGLQLCLSEQAQAETEAPSTQLANWATELSAASIPQAVIDYLRDFLDENATADTIFLTGLSIINHALQLRFAATRKVGQLKTENSLPVLDEARENLILESMQEQIEDAQLPAELLQLFVVIMAVVRDEHAVYSESH